MKLLIIRSTDNDQFNDYNLYVGVPDGFEGDPRVKADMLIESVKADYPTDWDCHDIECRLLENGFVSFADQIETIETV